MRELMGLLDQRLGKKEDLMTDWIERHHLRLTLNMGMTSYKSTNRLGLHFNQSECRITKYFS